MILTAAVAYATAFEGVLVYDDAHKDRPAIVMVPNWLGINDANIAQAKLIAGRGYTVFVADLYGKAARPKDSREAGKASGALKGDRALLRQRVQAAYDAFKAQKIVKVDKVGVIGFCFGGTAAIELAKNGAPLEAVVTFHAGLAFPAPGKPIKAKVLVLHGADDPGVPPAEVQAFQDAMRAEKADWQLVSFGGAVHSFTDVDAKNPGRNEYNPIVTKRAYALMDSLFAEVFPR